MSKTVKTREIERRLWQFTNRKKPVYGVFEVTVGYIAYGAEGYDRADYITLETDGTIWAYEIKTTVSDFHSAAKKSFIGDYNYLVLSRDVYEAVKDNGLPWGIGVVVENETGGLTLVRKSGHKNVSVGQRAEVVESMLKAATRDNYKWWSQPDSLYWK